MGIDRPGSSALGAKASLESGTAVRGIDTMTRRTTKEILLEVCAGRERQNQSHDDPVKHGDAPHRFHSLRHQPTSPWATSKHEGRLLQPRGPLGVKSRVCAIASTRQAQKKEGVACATPTSARLFEQTST